MPGPAVADLVSSEIDHFVLLSFCFRKKFPSHLVVEAVVCFVIIVLWVCQCKLISLCFCLENKEICVHVRCLDYCALIAVLGSNYDYLL